MQHESEMTSQVCRICFSKNHHTMYRVREMLHGTREQFDYFQCTACGCLQILTVPSDLSQYYPSDYQAYKNYKRKASSFLRRFVDRRRVRYEMSQVDALGRLFSFFAPPLDYVHWCKQTGSTQNSRVLDVGCGNGKLISRMLAGGFKHLRGVDPFIKQDIVFSQDAIIHKADLSSFAESNQGRFDLVMLHHSFEHMDNPIEVLGLCKQLMVKNGWLLIRVPLADSQAWEKYRENWFALDPPRHLYLYTSHSMSILAEKSGFRIVQEERDSSASQFIQSEWYVLDIPANEKDIRKKNLFTREQLRQFDLLSSKLNDIRRGDQGVFYLRKASDL